MKKIFFSLIIFLVFTFVLADNTNAQMINKWGGIGNDYVDCDQTESYFENLGDEAMKDMMGEEGDRVMEERMGEELSRQMHLRMGKAVTGCLEESGFASMMGRSGMMSGYWSRGMMNATGFGFFGWFGVAYHLVVALLFLAILILICMYLWKKVNQKEKTGNKH